MIVRDIGSDKENFSKKFGAPNHSHIISFMFQSKNVSKSGLFWELGMFYSETYTEY